MRYSIAKLTAIALIPGLALVIVFRIFQVRPSLLGMVTWLKRSLYMIIVATVGTTLVCGWWFLRNIFTYGEPSGTAAAMRFFAAKFIKADFTLPRTAGDLLRYTLESVWGRFGWNAITLPQEVYRFSDSAALVLVSLSVLAGIGVFVLWITRRRSPDITWQAFPVFLVIAITLVASYIQFNKSIGYQPQARYFFIMLLPGALLLTGGLYALAATPPLRVAASGILSIGLGLLNALALVTVARAGSATGGVRHHVRIEHMPPDWVTYLSVRPTRVALVD